MTRIANYVASTTCRLNKLLDEIREARLVDDVDTLVAKATELIDTVQGVASVVDGVIDRVKRAIDFIDTIEAIDPDFVPGLFQTPTAKGDTNGKEEEAKSGKANQGTGSPEGTGRSQTG